MALITISRQNGSLGREVAEQLASRLNMQLITRDRFIAEKMSDIATPGELTMLGQSPGFYLTKARDGITFKEHMEARLMEETSKTPSIVLGMGSQLIFANLPGTLKARIVASDETRIGRFGKKYGIAGNEAVRMLRQSDRRHRRYISTLYGADWSDPLLYDMVINTDKLTIQQCVELIVFSFDAKKSQSFPSGFEDQKAIPAKDRSKILFKHPAEEEFVNILDMYGIEWEYEPRTFPVRWDAEGNVTMAFSPDFYLTKFDTYIEITTMEQKYVTTKNKKVKLIRELYPDININIVYKKDFYSLLERFGFSGAEEVKEFNRSLE